MPTIFERDRVVRDFQNRPVGRVVLADTFEPGKPFKVAALKIPLTKMANAKGFIFHIEGYKYKVPDDISPIRITKTQIDLLINSFVMELVE